MQESEDGKYFPLKEHIPDGPNRHATSYAIGITMGLFMKRCSKEMGHHPSRSGILFSSQKMLNWP